MRNPNNVLALQQHGESETIVVRESKCLIRTTVDDQQVDCCAIFNGSNGTAIRSYVSDVLVNGSPATVRSLATGDEIELPCRTKLTVQAAPEIRPSISPRQRSAEEIDEQLSSLTGQPTLEKQEPAMIPQVPNEEKFLSPFSEDLPQILADATPATPSTETVAAPNASGSNDASADDSVVTSVDGQIGGLDDIQRHLQSLISATTLEAPQAQANVANSATPMTTDLSPFGNAAAGAAGVIASAAAATVATNVIDPANNEAAPQPTAPTPAPAIPTQDPPTSVAQNTAANESSASPSAELPTDLRNQLDDLMASLENQTNIAAASSAAPEYAVPATPEFTPPTPIASVDAPATPVPPVAPVQPTPVAPATPSLETNATPPVMVAPDSTLPPVFAADATPAPVEAELESAVPATAPPQQKNRSVAEVLGGMGIDVPGEEPNASQPAEPTYETPTAEPIQDPTQTAPAVPVFTNTPQAAAEQAPVSEVASDDPNDDIQAYMNRLLNRGSAEGTPVPEPVVAPVAVEEQVEVVVPLSPEEFVPNHKATRPANYESLREIANTSNRAALELSATKASSGSSLLRLLISFGALLAGIITFLFGLSYIASIFLIVAIIGFALFSIGRSAETKAISAAMQKASQSNQSKQS